MDLKCNSQTIRYVVAVAALTVLGAICVIVDGDIGNTIAVAVAGGIGYLAKDWRGKHVEENNNGTEEEG